jgi:hypothetical protein
MPPLLTETAIKAVKPAEKARKIYDERGLFLFVTATGARLWRMKYKIGGREKLLALGEWPHTSLKRARERRDEVRRLLADGIDGARPTARDLDDEFGRALHCPPDCFKRRRVQPNLGLRSSAPEAGDVEERSLPAQVNDPARHDGPPN